MAELTVDLFRSCRASRWGKGGDDKRAERFTAAFGTGALYPDYEGFMRKDNTFRGPDVTSMTDSNGQVWVLGVNDRDSGNRALVNWKEGVSVSTQPGGFGYDGDGIAAANAEIYQANGVAVDARQSRSSSSTRAPWASRSSNCPESTAQASTPPTSRMSATDRGINR